MHGHVLEGESGHTHMNVGAQPASAAFAIGVGGPNGTIAHDRDLSSGFELALERGAEVRAGEEVAMLALEGVLDQCLGSLGVRDPGIQLGDLALGQVVPGRAPPARRCEQGADLREGEPRVLVKANERDPLYADRRVLPSVAEAVGQRQQADPLVVAECRCRHAGAASQLPDRHQTVLSQGHPLDLKCASTWRMPGRGPEIN